MGLVERVEDEATGTIGYFRSEKSIKLEPAMNPLAEWAQCNIEAEIALATWMFRPSCGPCGERSTSPNFRAARRHPLPFPRRSPTEVSRYWFVVEPGADLPELCSLDPGRDVDLCVKTGVVSLGAIL